MDEKEKELLPEEVTDENIASAEETAEAQTQQELYEELEELKDMFQKELDEATVKAEQGELIQELSDIEEYSDEEEKPEMCECCGENPKATEYGEDYAYCESCRSFMKRYPIRKSGIFMLIIMIAVFIATAFASITAVDGNMYLLEGYASHSEGKRMSAIQNYYYYLSSIEGDNVSMKAVRNLIDDYTATGYMSDAVKLIEQYYSETDLKMPWNNKYKKIVEETALNTATYYAVSEIVSPAFSGEDFDSVEVIAQLDALREETDEEGNRKYSDLFIDFFSYEIMRLKGNSLEERLDTLLEMDKKHSGGGEWVYLPTLCSVAAQSGDIALAEKCFNRLMKINKQDSNAYIAYASCFRYLETPEPEKMLEIAKMAAANAYQNDVSYRQIYAVAYLLQGEGALALDEMKAFMSAGSYNVAQCNLYALIGLYNGNKDIYKEMKTILQNNGYEISDLVEQYKAKKITIEEVLSDKGGDIA